MLLGTTDSGLIFEKQTESSFGLLKGDIVLLKDRVVKYLQV